MTSPRRARRAAHGTLALVGVAWALACASHSDALSRGQRYYEDNQYERALALWRDLDRRGAEFGPAERARYAYFRGMTDYRLGYRDDARHWLAIAKATDAAHPGGLGTLWLERLDSALTDLARGASRAGGEGPDAVQTIEAPPGAVRPADRGANDDGPSPVAPSRPALDGPGGPGPGFPEEEREDLAPGPVSVRGSVTGAPAVDAGFPR